MKTFKRTFPAMVICALLMSIFSFKTSFAEDPAQEFRDSRIGFWKGVHITTADGEDVQGYVFWRTGGQQEKAFMPEKLKDQTGYLKIVEDLLFRSFILFDADAYKRHDESSWDSVKSMTILQEGKSTSVDPAKISTVEAVPMKHDGRGMGVALTGGSSFSEEVLGWMLNEPVAVIEKNTGDFCPDPYVIISYNPEIGPKELEELWDQGLRSTSIQKKIVVLHLFSSC